MRQRLQYDSAYDGRLHDARKRNHTIGRRQPPLFMIINLRRGLCWCGSPESNRPGAGRDFCSGAHQYWYHTVFHAGWDQFRLTMFLRDNYTCSVCGMQCGRADGSGAPFCLRLDHVKPLALGGAAYDEDNVQTLCKPCHAAKTASDITNIAECRRQCRRRLRAMA